MSAVRRCRPARGSAARTRVRGSGRRCAPPCSRMRSTIAEPGSRARARSPATRSRSASRASSGTRSWARMSSAREASRSTTPTSSSAVSASSHPSPSKWPDGHELARLRRDVRDAVRDHRSDRQRPHLRVDHAQAHATAAAGRGAARRAGRRRPDHRLRRLRRADPALPARLARLAVDRRWAAADAGRARDAARRGLPRRRPGRARERRAGPARHTARRRARRDRDLDRPLAQQPLGRGPHRRADRDRPGGRMRRHRPDRRGANDARAQPGDPGVPDARLRATALGDRRAAGGGRRALVDVDSPLNRTWRAAMESMRLPRPRHGDEARTTQELRDLAASILHQDVEALAHSTHYLRRSYRVVFVGYVAMMTFGVAAIVAAFVKGMTAASVGPAAAAIGLAGLTVGIFVAFFVQRPSAALERNAIFMPWVSIVLTTFWTRMLYLDDPATLDAKLGHAAKEASEELSAIALRYAVIDGKELAVAKEAARTRPVKPAS